VRPWEREKKNEREGDARTRIYPAPCLEFLEGHGYYPAPRLDILEGTGIIRPHV